MISIGVNRRGVSKVRSPTRCTAAPSTNLSILDNEVLRLFLIEMGKNPNQGNQFTVFKGGRSDYAPGMLIRQIN